MATGIEQHYQSSIDALTPAQRVDRCMAMLQWTREFLGRQVVAEAGPMSTERLKWEVAKRLYGADPTAIATIDEKLADVPR